MNKTRLSFYYIAAYLWLGGSGLIIAPQFSAHLLLSNTEYASVMLQSLGMFMIGLGIVVVQIIRLRIKPLYSTTLVVRPLLHLFDGFLHSDRSSVVSRPVRHCCARRVDHRD